MGLDITKYLAAGYPVLYLRTGEQERALQEIVYNLKQSGLDSQLEIFLWKVTKGLFPYLCDDPASERIAFDLMESLNTIATGFDGDPKADRLYIMFNVRDLLKTPGMLQQFRDTAYAIRTVGSHIICIGGAFEVPEELEDVITFLDFDMPTRDEIKNIFRGMISKHKDSLELEDVTDRELDVAAENATGLSAFKAENAISLSLVEKHRVDVDLLRHEKQIAVKQSGVIEYLHHKETADTLGGFELLKEHVGKRRKYFRDTKRAAEFGLNPPKGILLVGIAGCVSGETLVRYKRGSRVGGRFIRLEDFYKKFNGIPASTRPWVKECDTFLQSYDPELGRIVHNKVLGVYDKGAKPCVTLSTDGAGSITLTLDHPVLCADGVYRPAGTLSTGQKLLVRGSMKALGGETDSTSKYPNRTRIVVENLRYHPTGWAHRVHDRKTGNTYEYVRQHKARLVVEAHMNALEVWEFIRILQTDVEQAKTLKFLDPGLEVHHLDEDMQNDVLPNLMVMSKEEHTRSHCGEERFGKEYVSEATITGVENVGNVRVYDVSMQEPLCNFVVNEGIVVHNTGKTLAGKAISGALGLPLYKFDMGSIFKGIVGQSEAAVRQALKLAETVAPCVLLFDEFEKMFSGTQSSGKTDSGVTSRVVSTILSWMQETKAPIYKVATCNSIKDLDSALFRRGRWDSIFAVDLPTMEERREIFSIHLTKRGRTHTEEFDLGKLAEYSEGFVGAEIESVVEEALFAAFDDDRDVSTDDLAAVCKSVVPISKTDQEAINDFRRWMDGRATPVSAKKSAAPAKQDRSLRAGLGTKIH